MASRTIHFTGEQLYHESFSEVLSEDQGLHKIPTFFPYSLPFDSGQKEILLRPYSGTSSSRPLLLRGGSAHTGI